MSYEHLHFIYFNYHLMHTAAGILGGFAHYFLCSVCRVAGAQYVFIL